MTRSRVNPWEQFVIARGCEAVVSADELGRARLG